MAAPIGARIFWKPNENLLVAQQACAFIRQGEKSYLQAIRNAQLSLPDRRRKRTIKQRANVAEAAAILDKLLLQQSQHPEPPTLPPAPESNALVEEQAAARRREEQRAAAAEKLKELEEEIDALDADSTAFVEKVEEQQQFPPTESYVQPVPEKCDRITWRGQYYHLPLPPPLAQQQEEPAAQQQEERLPTQPEAVDILAMFGEQVIVQTFKRVITNPEVAAWLNSMFNRQLPNLAVEQRPADAVQQPKHNPTAPSSRKTGPPNVLVCGIKPHLYSTLQGAVSGKLNLKFWHDGGTGPGGGVGFNQLRDKLHSVQVAVYAMEAVSHQAVDLAKKAGVRVVRVTGATATMIETLKRIATELEQQ